MFEYEDPTGTGTLERVGAQPRYRALVHALYRRFGSDLPADFRTS